MEMVSALTCTALNEWKMLTQIFAIKNDQVSAILLNCFVTYLLGDIPNSDRNETGYDSSKRGNCIYIYLHYFQYAVVLTNHFTDHGHNIKNTK